MLGHTDWHLSFGKETLQGLGGLSLHSPVELPTLRWGLEILWKRN